MKVKVVKLDDRHIKYATDEEKSRIGKVFEAFKIKDDYQQDERYQEQYALNIGRYIWWLPIECCEVVEENIVNTTDAQSPQNPNFPNGILLVEDGSVDIYQLEGDGFYVIPYRAGSKPPIWLR